MPHEVLMPQLGMAQDSAIIVSWLKSAGDAVTADDPLMEVETDKATMEIPAGRDGFLTDIRAEAGTEVPVGEVIAIISENLEDMVAKPSPETAQIADNLAAKPASVAEIAPPLAKAPDVKVPPPAPTALSAQQQIAPERILASPKARFVAAERGLDLRAMVQRGAAQPIHYSDLDGALSASGGTVSVLTARITRRAIAGLVDTQTDPKAAQRHVLAAFAAGALRKARGATDQDLTVAVHNFDDLFETFKNPDISGGVDSGPHQAIDAVVDLTLYDLTETCLTAYQPANGPLTQMSVALDGKDQLALCLTFSETVLTAAVAVAFLDNFAARVEDPIRHIL